MKTPKLTSSKIDGHDGKRHNLGEAAATSMTSVYAENRVAEAAFYAMLCRMAHLRAIAQRHAGASGATIGDVISQEEIDRWWEQFNVNDVSEALVTYLIDAFSDQEIVYNYHNENLTPSANQ